MGPKNLHFQVLLMLLVQGPYFENHCLIGGFAPFIAHQNDLWDLKTKKQKNKKNPDAWIPPQRFVLNWFWI